MLESQSIINSSVYTKSGTILGKVIDVEVEISGQAIICYIIKAHKLFKKITSEKLYITPSQVIRIEKHKVIVEDSLVGGLKEKFSKEVMA